MVHPKSCNQKRKFKRVRGARNRFLFVRNLQTRNSMFQGLIFTTHYKMGKKDGTQNVEFMMRNSVLTQM